MPDANASTNVDVSADAIRTDTAFPGRFEDEAKGLPMPRTPEERAAYIEGVRGLAEALKAIPDDPNESDEDFFRAMDADRPDFPLFKGLY